MPKVNVTIPSTGAFLFFDIGSDQPLATLKEFINAETGIPKEHLTLFLDGRVLSDDAQSIAAVGIKDDDMLAANVQAPEPPRTQSSAQPNSQSAGRLPTGDQNLGAAAEQLRQALLRDPNARASATAQAPELAAALNDPSRFQALFAEHERKARQAQQAREAQLAALDDDVTEENQAKIAEYIRQAQIEKEYNEAYESNPEFFASVTMLYVNIEINGHPIKAFVDSGAQATIMSPSCAEACNVTHKIDKRFQGVARGVGTAKILGRVHSATIRIGDAELPCSFTVMEGKDVDILFGLDMLKRYQACIDLTKNRLVLAGGVSVPFLGESELPKHFEQATENEPVVTSPDGAKIGAKSGAVKQDPSSSSAGASSSSKPAGSAFSGAGRTLDGPSERSTTAGRPPPPRPQAPTPAAANPAFPQASIDTLLGIGATREKAIEALTLSNGDVERAAGWLFDQY